MSHPIVITFLIMAVVGAMSLAAEVLKPLAFSVLLAFALTPLASFFERKGLPRAPSVVLTVLLALGALGGIGYVVFGQLEHLAARLPDDRERIEKKLSAFRSGKESAMAKAQMMANDVATKLYTKPTAEKEQGDTASVVAGQTVTDVRILQEPKFRERLQEAVGPYLEFLGVGSFVLILVLFMMMGREDLRDRIVSLFGHSRVSLTTRTLEEMGRRISRYLATFAAVNSAFGLVIGLGLAAIGVPYAVLWGCLAGMLRFIPYVGPAVAFALPLIFSVAEFETWRQPILVFALFAVVEVALNSFLEPVIYGKTTGVSALGLLVAAMFWTWLWGTLGILLSTPLTVCLAVLGKYVPSLGVFATLLGEESELDPDVKFYQRLVALDGDGAVEVFECAAKTRPRAEVFDAVLVPALSRAERDAADGHLEDSDLAFVWRVVGDLVDDFDGAAEITLGSAAAAAPGGARPLVLGLAAVDTADAVVLRMLAQLVAPAGVDLEVIDDATTPMQVAERVASKSPAMVVLSQLPPSGLATARYQVRRLRARFPDLTILVGRWGASGNADEAASGLKSGGATEVALSLAGARDYVLPRLAAGPAPAPGASAPLPDAPAASGTGQLVNVGG